MVRRVLAGAGAESRWKHDTRMRFWAVDRHRILVQRRNGTMKQYMAVPNLPAVWRIKVTNRLNMLRTVEVNPIKK